MGDDVDHQTVGLVFGAHPALMQDYLDDNVEQPESFEADPPQEPTEEQKQVQAADAGERARRKAIAATDRSDTIMTSPLGLTYEPDTKRKTLLGA